MATLVVVWLLEQTGAMAQTVTFRQGVDGYRKSGRARAG
jgi:hypothetical protein